MALDHWRKDLVASVRDLAFTRSGRQCCVWRTDTMLWVIWLPLANALVQRRRLVHGVETPESLLKELVSTHLSARHARRFFKAAPTLNRACGLG